MKLNNVKVDFQSTGWIVEKDNPARFGPLSRRLIDKIEGFDKNLLSIVRHAYKIGENRALCLLDYYQPKYRRVISEGLEDIEERGFEVDDNYVSHFIGVTKDRGKSWLYLIRGKEYFCNEGHLIAVGHSTSAKTEPSWYTNGPKLEEVIKFERGRDGIIIPPHPLSHLGILTKVLLLALREPSRTNLGLQLETIRRNAHNFDALEAYSLTMNQEQTQAVEDLAKQFGLPTVSNTDGDIKSNFTAYNTFRELDFTSPSTLRASIRKGLRNRSYTETRGKFANRLTDKINHILINIAQHRSNF